MLYMVACCCSSNERRNQFDAIVTGLAQHGRRMKEGLWIIEADEPATHLRDHIKSHLEGCDSVIVALLAGHGAWHGFDHNTEDWLLANL